MDRQPSCRCGSVPVMGLLTRCEARCLWHAVSHAGFVAQVFVAQVFVAQGSSSIGQSPGLQNRWLGVRVPPALRVRSGEPAKAGGRIGEDMATQTRGEAAEKRSGSGRASK